MNPPPAELDDQPQDAWERRRATIRRIEEDHGWTIYNRDGLLRHWACRLDSCKGQIAWLILQIELLEDKLHDVRNAASDEEDAF